MFEAKGVQPNGESEEQALAVLAEYEEMNRKSNTANRVAIDLMQAGPAFK